MVHIISDDTSNDLVCSHSPSLQCNYSSVYSNAWLNGTAVESANGPVTLTFSGISAAFYASGIFNKTANATIFIDGEKAVMSISSFKDPWFSTKTLQNSQHNITFETLPDGFVIDYITITPGNDTFLVGKQLIVDDTDPSLTYAGQWKKNTTTTMPVRSDWDDLLGPGLSKYNTTSFGGGFQETEDPRASFNFTFIGSSVSVYGFYDFKYPSLPVIFTIDGENDHTSDGFSLYLEQANYLWFESGSLFPGSHVLSVTFVGSSSSSISNPGGRFTLDYIIYTPSFSSLATQGDPTSMASSSILMSSSTRQFSLPTITPVSRSESTAVLMRRTVNKKIQAIARLAPDPYPNVPNRSQVSGERLIVPVVEFRKGVQSAAQERTAVTE